MNQGKLVETGTRQQVLSAPKEDYTRMLISSVPSLIPNQKPNLESEIVLDVQDLHKVYNSAGSLFGKKPKSVVAAKDINFQIHRREILGIVGESGSGKSTVARCVMRLTDPSSGVIALQGKNITTLSRSELAPLRQRIQMIFQDPYRSLNPRRTVGKSVIEGLLNYGMSYAEAMQKAKDTMPLVGLNTDVLERYPHQFSGGQRQRICIARALVMEPDVLVADEAVSALDVSVQAQVLDLLDEIRQRTGVGVLFITHDLRVAAQICDTIIVMQKGQVVEAGSAMTVLKTPQHSYTQTLLQAAPGRQWDFQNFQPIPTLS